MIYKFLNIDQTINENNFKIFLLYGENLGLKNIIKDKIRKNNVDAEIINFSQDDLIKNKEMFFGKFNNLSLFEKKKIILLNNVNDKSYEIVQELENYIKDQKVYLFADLLEKKSKIRNYFEKSKKNLICPCYADNEVTIRRIILERLKDFKGLNTHNINLIIETCAFDRNKLENELNKILIFFENKILESNNLEKLLNIKINNDFNLLKDEAISGNKNKTNKLLSETIFDNEKNILYLNIINQRFNKLYQILENTNNSNLEIAVNSIKPPIFWKDKPTLISQAKKWNKRKIKSIMNRSYKIEKEIKSNAQIDHSIMIKKFLVDICRFSII
tara:strand:+ start:6564 stop:7553 length:990 start_codon:yes stop_codon:yes gene_type:complete